ncbi:MAG: mechanosensitive ion channel family protein [Bdellovibrio sp.]
MNEKFIKTQSLYTLLDLEPFVILSALLLLAWVFYKLFLRDVSEERHRNLRNHFTGLFRHFLILSVLFATFAGILQLTDGSGALGRSLPYLGILTFAWGGAVFVKVCRLIILQYLFLGSMKAGVPVLIVNIFSLLMSVVLFLWGASQIFGIQLAPLLATSAAFSIILGLALQDTLGNLFAGISLQLDKSFEIGDWVEVTQGMQKTVGQVKEITWRATTLIGWTDEVIVIPNRTMANSHISNFQSGDVPIVRSQMFRLPYGSDLAMAQSCLLASIQGIPEVRTFPEAVCVVTENHDSWMGLKLAYYIDNYGAQYTVGHKVLTRGLEYLKANGISVTHTTIKVLQPPPHTY